MGRWGLVRFGALLWLLALPGCGEEAGEQPGEAAVDSHVGKSGSALIKAATGGELAVGAAKIKVSPGALDKDTEISVKVLDKKTEPQSKDIVLDLYELSPEGLVFKEPAEIAFDVSKVMVPTGKRLDIAQRDKQSGQFKALPDPQAKQGMMSVKASTSGTFTAILTPADAPAPGTPGQCGADFVACGGDLSGTWMLTTGCITAPPAALGVEVPAQFDACTPRPAAQVVMGVSGTVTFGSDGSYSNDQTTTLTPGLVVPQSCLDQLSQTQGSQVACADVEGTLQGATCVRAFAPQTSTDTSMGTYTAADGTLSVTPTTDGQVPDQLPSISYCVIGDSLTLRVENAAEQRVDVYTAQRRLN